MNTSKALFNSYSHIKGKSVEKGLQSQYALNVYAGEITALDLGAIMVLTSC